MLPHTLVGIGAAGYLVFLLLWRLFGTDIPGTVTGSEISHSSKHGDSYILHYNYRVDREIKSDSGSVTVALFQQYQSLNRSNAPVMVHYFSIGALEHAALRESGSLWTAIGFLTLWAGFWNLVVGIFVYQLWVKPLATRWLYKYGGTARGTITRKRVQKGKSSTYYVSYSFNDPVYGKSYEAEIVVWNPATWQLASEGQRVTILYSRNNPKWSTVYEFGGYQVQNG